MILGYYLTIVEHVVQNPLVVEQSIQNGYLKGGMNAKCLNRAVFYCICVSHSKSSEDWSNMLSSSVVESLVLMLFLKLELCILSPQPLTF